MQIFFPIQQGIIFNFCSFCSICEICVDIFEMQKSGVMLETVVSVNDVGSLIGPSTKSLGLLERSRVKSVHCIMDCAAAPDEVIVDVTGTGRLSKNMQSV